MKRTAKIEFAQMPVSYRDLVAMHTPRPLHDRIDEENIEEIVSAMAGHQLTEDQEDYLDLLSDLLDKYQADAHGRQRRKTTPQQRLVRLVEESGITPEKLTEILVCSQPLVSLILSGKRELSKPKIGRLASYFKLNPGYFYP